MYCCAHKTATLTPIQHTVGGGADYAHHITNPTPAQIFRLSYGPGSLRSAWGIWVVQHC